MPNCQGRPKEGGGGQGGYRQKQGQEGGRRQIIDYHLIVFRKTSSSKLPMFFGKKILMPRKCRQRKGLFSDVVQVQGKAGRVSDNYIALF